MDYNVKNYTEQNGEKTVIGGELEITGTLTIGSEAVLHGLPTASNQADSEAETVETLRADLNDLLAKLKTAGLMLPDSESENEPESEPESE